MGLCKTVYVNYHRLVFHWTSFKYKMKLVYCNANSVKVYVV